MGKLKEIKFTLIIFFCETLVACSTSTNAGLSTAEPTRTPFPTISQSSTTTIRPTNTFIPPNTSTPLTVLNSKYSELPSGQYIIYTAPGGIYAMSVDGSIDKQLLLDENGYLVSQGGRKAIVSDNDNRFYLMDLVSNSSKDLNGYTCSARSASPEGNLLLLECGDGSISLYSTEDGSHTTIKSPQNAEDHFAAPLWSPDGKWIAYFGMTFDSVHGYRNGLFIMDSSCLPNPEDCPKLTKGPYYEQFSKRNYPYSWSPDSRYLAVPNESTGKIVIFDTQTRTSKVIPLRDKDSDALSTAWSPDGEWIAFSEEQSGEESSATQLCIITPTGLKETCVPKSDSTVETWLLVPTRFFVGDQYKITETGSNLNVRKEPSLTATSLAKLTKGDSITPIEAPIESEGYTWWKIRTKDGIEGWVVDIPEWYEKITE